MFFKDIYGCVAAITFCCHYQLILIIFCFLYTTNSSMLLPILKCTCIIFSPLRFCSVQVNISTKGNNLFFFSQPFLKYTSRHNSYTRWCHQREIINICKVQWHFFKQETELCVRKGRGHTGHDTERNLKGIECFSSSSVCFYSRP